MDAVNVIPLNWIWTLAVLLIFIVAIVILSYFFFLGRRIRHGFEKWRNGKKPEVFGKCPECGKEAAMCLGCGLCKECCVVNTGGTKNEKENN
jgi:hypothetical protein